MIEALPDDLLSRILLQSCSTRHAGAVVDDGCCGRAEAMLKELSSSPAPQPRTTDLRELLVLRAVCPRWRYLEVDVERARLAVDIEPSAEAARALQAAHATTQDTAAALEVACKMGARAVRRARKIADLSVALAVKVR
eukprot:tig00020996_g16952.t1